MPSLVLVSMNLDSRFSLLNWCLGIFCRGNYVSTAEPWWLLLPWWFWSALWPTALYSGNIESPSHQGPYPLSLHLRRLKLAWASLEKTLPFNPILLWFSTIWSGFLFISLILHFWKQLTPFQLISRVLALGPLSRFSVKQLFNKEPLLPTLKGVNLSILLKTTPIPGWLLQLESSSGHNRFSKCI